MPSRPSRAIMRLQKRNSSRFTEYSSDMMENRYLPVERGTFEAKNFRPAKKPDIRGRDRVNLTHSDPRQTTVWRANAQRPDNLRTRHNAQLRPQASGKPVKVRIPGNGPPRRMRIPERHAEDRTSDFRIRFQSNTSGNGKQAQKQNSRELLTARQQVFLTRIIP